MQNTDSMHGQEGTLHYFSTVINSGVVYWDLIFFFSQANQGNSGEQLTGDCKGQEKKNITIKKCLTVWSYILLSDTRVPFPFTYTFEGTVSNACFWLCLYFQNTALQGPASIHKSLKSWHFSIGI